MKKICIVAGARPNFIKVAPVIRAIPVSYTHLTLPTKA